MRCRVPPYKTQFVVESLVPPARLGAVLGVHRRELGMELDELAARSSGRWSVSRLIDIEQGRIAVDDAALIDIASLYGLQPGPILPSRNHLIIDLDNPALLIGEQRVTVDSPVEVDRVLERYLSLLYLLRNVKPGSDLTLRDHDLLVLSESLEAEVALIERRLGELMLADSESPVVASLRRRLMLPGAGLLVGVTALGSLVLLSGDAEQVPAQGVAAPSNAVPALSVPAQASSIVIERLDSASAATVSGPSGVVLDFVAPESPAPGPSADTEAPAADSPADTTTANGGETPQVGSAASLGGGSGNDGEAAAVPLPAEPTATASPTPVVEDAAIELGSAAAASAASSVGADAERSAAEPSAAVSTQGGPTQVPDVLATPTPRFESSAALAAQEPTATATVVPTPAPSSTPVPPPPTAIPQPTTAPAPIPTVAPTAVPVVPTPPPVVQQVQPTSAADHGAAAEARIGYNWRSALPGWTVVYASERSGYRGLTNTPSRTVTIYIRSGDSVGTTAEILAHELGHALDVTYLTNQQRSQWLDARGMPQVWWAGEGLTDFSVGAGDFAEAIAALWVGSPSYSAYGGFTGEQLQLASSFLP